MNLYLVRHGEAKSKGEDPSRGLSENGKKDIKKIAADLARRDIKVNRIFHSEKLRAMQTAQIISENISTEYPIAETDGLSPMDDPRTWYERIHDIDEDTMLVGHLPYMSMFSALLLSGGKDAGLVEFQTGEAACFNRPDDGSWKLVWKTAPKDVI